MKIAAILAAKGDSVATVAPTYQVVDLLRVLAEHGIGAVVVADDEGTIRGIASERDVVRALEKMGRSVLDAPVSTIMTEVVVVGTPKSSIEEIAIAMTNERVRHVPVLNDEGALAGIVSIGDVVKARIDQLEHDRKTLLKYITT